MMQTDASNCISLIVAPLERSITAFKPLFKSHAGSLWPEQGEEPPGDGPGGARPEPGAGPRQQQLKYLREF